MSDKIPNTDAGVVTDHRAQEVARLARQCVQCGLCVAACPTFALSRDERDGPRGRITLIQGLFGITEARDAAPPLTPLNRQFLDRCLGCLSCVPACPSDVDYRQLISHARVRLEATVRRPWAERVARRLLASVLPRPDRLRWALRCLPAARRLRGVLRGGGLGLIADLVDQASAQSDGGSARSSAKFAGPGKAAIQGTRRGRVLLLAGCAQQVVRPDITDAAIRLLARRGIEVEVAAGVGCCGGIAADLGREADAVLAARATIDGWWKVMQREPVDAILTTAGGCGTNVEGYASLLADDPDYAERAAVIAETHMDVCAFLARAHLGPPLRWSSLKVAYQSACTLQNGEGVFHSPRNLLYDAGFTVVDLPEGHLCCGAAGPATLLQKPVGEALAERKAAVVDKAKADLVATGQVNCLTRLSPKLTLPIAHTVELLDWAYGGPVPNGLESLSRYVTDVPLKSTLGPDDYLAPIDIDIPKPAPVEA